MTDSFPIDAAGAFTTTTPVAPADREPVCPAVFMATAGTVPTADADELLVAPVRDRALIDEALAAMDAALIADS